MSYLIDTNVLSELKRKTPDPRVMDWFVRRSASALYVSVLTLGELRKGIDGMPDERRRLNFLDWLENEVPLYFNGRVLPIDAAVADRWGRLQAAQKRPLPVVDSLLAATALEHDLVLITRNTKDFVGLPVELFNPWQP